jgi:hypothetical protein
MKHEGHFKVLLEDTVNLSKFNLDLLDSRTAAIYSALLTDPVLGPYVKAMIPQGSWAHETIIRPAKGREFDADFLLLLAENPEWSQTPKRYIDQVYYALEHHSTYKDMPHHRKCRCVRLVYANSCHVDIVPHLILDGGREVIVNRDEDVWEDTAPEAFTRWMKERDDITTGNLRRVIRLIKYLRDHRGHFEGTRSVILTALLGERVDAVKKMYDSGYYATLPDALLHIVQDLDEWLRAQVGRPTVYDPSGSGLTFDHRWSDESFEHFRDRIQCFAAEMSDAYNEADPETSVKLWQDIFGAGFKAPPPKETSGRFGPVVPAAPRSGRAG